MILEVIATTLKEAIDIEKSGADRIELVTGISDGGLNTINCLNRGGNKRC